MIYKIFWPLILEDNGVGHSTDRSEIDKVLVNETERTINALIKIKRVPNSQYSIPLGLCVWLILYLVKIVSRRDTPKLECFKQTLLVGWMISLVQHVQYGL